MTEDEFWSSIAQARSAVDDGLDGEAVAEAWTQVLAALPVDDIVAAGSHLNASLAKSYTWELWGAAYVINGGASDDGFDYFRSWLVMQGRDVFDRALADPDSLADLLTAEDQDAAWAENVISAPWQAYQRRTGSDSMPSTRVPLPDLGDEWDFDDEEEMRRRYPRLTGVFF